MNCSICVVCIIVVNLIFVKIEEGVYRIGMFIIVIVNIYSLREIDVKV